VEAPRLGASKTDPMEEELNYPLQVAGDSSHGKLDGHLSQTPITGFLKPVKPLKLGEFPLYLGLDTGAIHDRGARLRQDPSL